MKTRLIKTTALCLSLALLPSCKDFFDIKNPQTLSPENFPSSMEQVDLMLTSAYAQSHSIGMYAFYWFPMGVWLYDHTTDLYGIYDARATSMDNYTSINSIYITTSYTDLCKWMKLATDAINGIEKYRTTALADENAQLDYMRGQALFNRALAYWHAQIYFEINPDALGFPIIKQDNVQELERTRATVRETWTFMINDLVEACDLLTGYKDEFRATEWAAKGLLAKVYMQSLYIFPENKQKAKELMEDIIQNSGKTLVPYEVYSDMFYGNEANEHNSESLYELTMTTNYRQSGPWKEFTSGSGMPMVYAPWYVDLDVIFRDKKENVTDPITLPQDISVTKKSSEWGNNFVHDRNIARFGFADFHGDTMPRWTFNENFDAVADKRTPRSQEKFPYRLADVTYVSDALALKNDKSKVDPRLKLCAGQPFVDDYIDAEGRTSWYSRSTEVENRPDILGWQHRKYTNIRGVEMGGFPGQNQSGNYNFYIVRLADIYLLYAELLQDDDPATALEYVNKVHRRAYGVSPDSPSEFDYQTLTDKTKTAVENDELANDVIRYERWAELFAEGQWWFDVRRYQIGEKEAQVYKETRHGPITWKGECSYVQPIPQLELERNLKMKQSAGYPSVH